MINFSDSRPGSMSEPMRACEKKSPQNKHAYPYTYTYNSTFHLHDFHKKALFLWVFPICIVCLGDRLDTEPLLREMKLCSIDVRFKLKLLIHTYRCTNALASSLLCQQYKLRSHSNSTHSTTRDRSQLTLSLCIPSAARRPDTISPLFTSTPLWNSLPSPIRSASSLHTFRQELQKYLGIPVIRPR